jgi:hypothetical protein
MLSSEEGGDGGFCFIACKRRNVICSEMHAWTAYQCAQTLCIYLNMDAGITG